MKVTVCFNIGLASNCAITSISDVTSLKSSLHPINSYVLDSSASLTGVAGAVADFPSSTCSVFNTVPSQFLNTTVYTFICFANSTTTVTSFAGIAKLVPSISSPFTLILFNSYPSSGVTVNVTVLPSDALATSAAAVPFPLTSTVIEYSFSHPTSVNTNNIATIMKRIFLFMMSS